MLRIPPPIPDAMRPDVAQLLRVTAQPGREPPGTMAVLAHQPALLSPFIGWAAALALKGTLSHRDHELLALRVAWRCRSAFEWAEHVELARAAGLRDDEIAKAAEHAIASTWAPSEAALLRATDELVAAFGVSDESWASLAAHYELATLGEITFVVGQYTMLSMVANAAGIGTGPADEPLPPLE
jgi:4-carboxymuconolactone decarboxylase